jgi:hypothetical protein
MLRSFGESNSDSVADRLHAFDAEIGAEHESKSVVSAGNRAAQTT